MSELSFAELFEESEKNETKIRTGSIVEGKVIGVKPDEIIVDIQYKADGIITRNEYSNTPNLDLTTVVKEGDPITVKVIKTNDGDGQVLLSYKRVASEKSYEALQEAFDNQTVLKGVVTQVVSGGLTVLVDECKVFVPASLVSDVFEKDLNKYLNQEIEFIITEFNPKKRRVIGNRKTLVAAKKAELAKKALENLHDGDIVKGSVKNITPFGAFVDLGGVDGLLHISEMSWSRVDNPKNVVEVGEELEVMIKSIDGEKIALTRKLPGTNPWDKAAEQIKTGDVITGKVARMTTFGAFVEVLPGVDALLHVSQISNKRVEKPEDVLTLGQEITAKVVDFKLEEKKISLSMRALIDNGQAETSDDTDAE
jgi:ribosomal protein S1